MKTYEELAGNALDRIHAYERKKKERRKTAVRIAVPAAGVCLVTFLCIGAWQLDWFKTVPPFADTGKTDDGYEPSCETGPDHSDNETEPQESITQTQEVQISTEDEKGKKETDPDPASGFYYLWWNNLKVSGTLKNAMVTDPDRAVFVLATYRPATANIRSFSFSGKTLAEWATEAFEENASKEAKEGYVQAYNAYLETVLPPVLTRLTEKGILCERSAEGNNGLTLFVTAEELRDMPFDDPENWTFDLASCDIESVSGEKTEPDGLRIAN